MYIQERGERRESVRLGFVSDVIVRTDDGSKTMSGTLVNLGIGGLAFSTPEKVDRGTPCTVEIIINDQYSQLIIKDVAGVVVRAADGEMALKFEHRFEWLTLFHVYHTKSA